MIDQLPTQEPTNVAPVAQQPIVAEASTPASTASESIPGSQTHPPFTLLSWFVGIYVILFVFSMTFGSVLDSNTAANIAFYVGSILGGLAALSLIVGMNQAVSAKTAAVKVFVFIASLVSGVVLFATSFVGAVIMTLAVGPPLQGD